MRIPEDKPTNSSIVLYSPQYGPKYGKKVSLTSTGDDLFSKVDATSLVSLFGSASHSSGDSCSTISPYSFDQDTETHTEQSGPLAIQETDAPGAPQDPGKPSSIQLFINSSVSSSETSETDESAQTSYADCMTKQGTLDIEKLVHRVNKETEEASESSSKVHVTVLNFFGTQNFTMPSTSKTSAAPAA